MWMSSLQVLVEEAHRGCLCLFGDVDVWAHCLVVGVAGPFHYDLRRDAAGEGETDESPAAGVGADERPFGVGLLNFLAGAEEHFGNRSVEAAEFAEVFEVGVHLLVGYYRQGEAVRVFVVLIFVENGFGETVEVDREAVVGLLGGDIEAVSDNVASFDFGHIRISEAGECAEAEEVAGLGEGSGFLHGLLIFEAVHIGEFDLGPVGRNLIVVEFEQLVFGEEDDRLFEDLEFRAVLVYLLLLAVVLADGPVEEPFEVVELLLDGLLLKILLDAEEADELVDAFLVEVIVTDALVEGFEVVTESLPTLEGGVGPLVGYAFFPDELVEVVEEGLDGHRGFGVILFLSGCNLILAAEFIKRRRAVQMAFVIKEVCLNFGNQGVDFRGGYSAGVGVARFDSAVLPGVFRAVESDAGHIALAANRDGYSDGVFVLLVRDRIEVKSYGHSSVIYSFDL